MKFPKPLKPGGVSVQRQLLISCKPTPPRVRAMAVPDLKVYPQTFSVKRDSKIKAAAGSTELTADSSCSLAAAVFQVYLLPKAITCFRLCSPLHQKTIFKPN